MVLRCRVSRFQSPVGLLNCKNISSL